MKNYLTVFIVILFFTSCNNSTSHTKNTFSNPTETIANTTPSIKAEGTMTAKINGKQWAATSLMPPETAGRIVGYSGKEYIDLPYSKQYMKAGKKIILGEDEAADIFFTGVGLCVTKSGEMEIIKVDEHTADGKFYFTAIENASGKSIEVTNGFFKIFLDK